MAISGAGKGTVGSPFDPVTWVLSGSRVIGEVARHGACTAQSSVDLYAFHGTHPDGTVVEAVDVVTQIGADAAITDMANGSFDLRITGTPIITSWWSCSGPAQPEDVDSPIRYVADRTGRSPFRGRRA